MGIHMVVMFQRITDPLVEIRNVFYVGGTGTTSVHAITAGLELYSWYDTILAPVLSTRWSLYAMGIKDASIPGTQLLDVLIPGTTGSRPEDLIPPQLSSPIFFKTGTPPPNRKWIQISGFTEASIGADSLLVSTTRTALQDFADALITFNAGEPPTGQFVAAHYDAAEGRYNASNAIVTGTASGRTGTQRSRIVGRGI